MEGMERWVQETFAPIVLCCTTPEVERIAQKNNLSFADLLNGFSMLKNVDTPVRSVNHSYTLGTFNFQFLPVSQLNPLPVPDSMRLLNEVISRFPPPVTSNVIDLSLPPVRSADDVSILLRTIIGTTNTSSEPLPWYREFKRVLMDTFRCEEYSMFTHPVGFLLVVSSTEGNPRHCFEQLGAAHHLPMAFQQGLYDPHVPKYYVVVHDIAETEGTSIDPDAILQNLNIPMHSGAVLRINSIPIESATSTYSHLWTNHPYVRPPLFSDPSFMSDSYHEYIGGVQSQQDIQRLQSFVSTFATKFILPSMETRIFQLNEIVSAMKKGVKNVFKSWLRKPKELTSKAVMATSPSSSFLSHTNTNITYRYDTIEAQTRLLADTAFMLRDYDTALQSYRLARDDYKSDKSMFHCANTNEMIALCLLLTKGSPMQMTNALDAATTTYYKITNAATCRLAVRAAVIAGQIYTTLSHSGLFTDYMDHASTCLIRGSTMEQGICSAVLMERAAMCDLQARSPKFRKFGFRMVMAGHVYDSLGHSAHSARCYAMARAVYDASGWYQVEDHINFTLAQQSNRLHDPMASIHLFLKLIGTGRNSASQQEALLYEFGMIVNEFLQQEQAIGPHPNGLIRMIQQQGRMSLVVCDLCMPELNDLSTVVYAPSNAFGINRLIDGNRDEQDIWKEVENGMEKQIQLHRYAITRLETETPLEQESVWLTPSRVYNISYRHKNKSSLYKKPEQYALGETIYVEIEMKNALSCTVEVGDIHLYGTFTPRDTKIPCFHVPEVDQRIVVEHVTLQLLPVSEQRVRLSICPRMTGTLTITGIRWSICNGDVHGEHAFHIPGPLLQDTRAHKETRARAPNTSLIADVVGAMPWLGIEMKSHNTDQVFVGELLRYTVILKNAGTAEMEGLQVGCLDFTLCAMDVENGLAKYIGATGQVVDLSHIRLQPQETRTILIWGRATRVGKQSARLLFKYRRRMDTNVEILEDDVASTTSFTRMVKVKLDLNVLPCVNVSYTLESSFVSSGEYILALTTSNQRQDCHDRQGLIQLESLTCISKDWEIVPFIKQTLESKVRSSTLLQVNERSTLYFRVLAKKRSEEPCNSSVALNQITQKDVQDMPLKQMLCLDHAIETVRVADAAAAAADAGVGNDNGGGMRSIQSVRRDNKALKGSEYGAKTTVNPNSESALEKKMRDPQPTTPEALFHEMDHAVDAHFMLVWSTPKAHTDLPAIGQTNLTPVRIRAPWKPTTCPLTVTMKYKDVVTLNTEPSGVSVAELDVMMTIRNESMLNSPLIDFTLEMLPPESSKTLETNEMITTPSPYFFWTGITKKMISSFAPDASITIPLKACFMTTGIYNLNRFRLIISRSTDTFSVFEFPAEYLVYVHSPSLV